MSQPDNKVWGECLSCGKDVPESAVVTGSLDDDVDVFYCSVKCRDSYEQGRIDAAYDAALDRIKEERHEKSA